MKLSPILGLLVMSLVGTGCSHLHHAQKGVAVIEFERQEDNGSVNILPCILFVSDHQKVILSGGERAVLTVSPGSFSVTAFSADPYSPNSTATAWRSPRTRIQVSTGERLRVRVEPTATGSTYSGGWTIWAANKITGPNAGGLRQLSMPTSLTARVGQFYRSAKSQCQSEKDHNEQ